MLTDQLHVDIDRNECIRTNFVQNGYFYILYYEASTSKSRKTGFDNNPLIYCAAPDEVSFNSFWGINLHYFTKDVQLYIIEQMQKQYNAFSEDTRIILDGKQLNNVYSNMAIGLRCYSRKNVFDCYRIKTQYVPKYLDLDGKFKIITPATVITDFNIAPGNKGF